MNKFGKKISYGFTLLEILAVIAIIVTLIGIGIPAYESWRNRGQKERARAVISQIEMALEMYKSDNGVYPNYNEDLNSAGADSLKISICLAPYVQFKSEDLDSDKDIVIDPWSNPSTYKPYRVFVDHDGNSTTNAAGFDHNRSSCYIHSSGPNGAFGDADDIDNYKR